MTWAVYINETPLADLGVYVESVGGWLHAPSRTYAVTPVPGRIGGVLTTEPTYGSRNLTIRAAVVTSANTVAARVTAEQKLRALALRGLVTLTFDDDVNAPLRIDAVCQAIAIEPRSHPMTAQVAGVEMSFVCPDPTYYALQGSILTFASTPTPVPLGNAPSGGIVRIVAPKWSAASVTTPTLTYYSAGGAAVKSLAFSGVTLVAEQDFLEVDLDRQTVVLSDAGVRSNAIAQIESGDFFSLDPMDGDVSASAWPQLRVTSGTGSAVATLTYRKRWL